MAGVRRRTQRSMPRTGRAPSDRRVAPAKPSRTAIDEEALAAIKADLRSQAEAQAMGRRRIAPGVGNTLPPTGLCHECSRPVTGERRFCGRCMARR